MPKWPCCRRGNRPPAHSLLFCTPGYCHKGNHVWAACTTHLTWQINRLREDRERRDAAQTDQVAPLQLKAGIVAGTKVQHCERLLATAAPEACTLTRSECQKHVGKDSSANSLVLLNKNWVIFLYSYRSAGSVPYCFLTLLWQHFSSTVTFPDKDTKTLKGNMSHWDSL